MNRYRYRIAALLLLLLVASALCHSWSGRIVGVAYGDTLTGKNVKTFTSSDLEHETSLVPLLYVLEKLKSSDIVFLGMTHRRPPLLEFVRDLVPHLHEAGVTHIGLEIPSDQQPSIDRFMNTGESLDQIELYTQIECPEYRDFLRAIRRLNKGKRPEVIALDLPTSLYSGEMSRDEWMAHSIKKLFNDRGVKVFVVVGNLHVIKDIKWEDKVMARHSFISSYLFKLTPQLRLFSIGQCIDEAPSQCDFTKTFGHIEGAVAVNCDERFADWKIGIVSPVAAKPTPVCDMFDGVIIY